MFISNDVLVTHAVQCVYVCVCVRERQRERERERKRLGLLVGFILCSVGAQHSVWVCVE